MDIKKLNLVLSRGRSKIMEEKKFMNEELKGLLKTLAIRMVDAMELWGDKETPRGAKPSWSEKEHAMIEYLASRDGVNALLSVIYTDLDKLPEGTETIGLVTTKFIFATCKLLEEYRDIEYPEKEPAENPVKEATHEVSETPKEE